MIKLVTGLLGGQFGAAILWALVAVFALLLGTIGMQYVQKADLRAALATSEARKSELEAALTVQNSKVDAMAAGCQAEADAAVAQALRALNSPPPPAPGTGPAHLNTWLKERARAR